MKIEEFINTINNKGWGIAIFNTYHLNNILYFFFIVNFKSEYGQFMKKEGTIDQLQKAFNEVIGDLNQ